MAKVKIKAGKDSFENVDKDQGDFVVPPAGYYTMVLKECNDGFSKDQDGNVDKKRPRLECIYEIVGVGQEDGPVEENYGNIWDYVSFSDESEWKRAEFLWALGLVSKKGDADVTIDTDEITGKKVLARLKREKGRGADDAPRAKVAKLLRFSDADSEAAFGSGGGEEDETSYSDDEAGDDELWTEESLSELELKELGEAAKEFDLNPEDFIVRNRAKKVDTDKTKEAVIAAILEAQNGTEEESGGADDGDSPF